MGCGIQSWAELSDESVRLRGWALTWRHWGAMEGCEQGKDD